MPRLLSYSLQAGVAEARVKAQNATDKNAYQIRLQRQAALRKRNEDQRDAGPKIALRRLKDKKRREQIQLVSAQNLIYYIMIPISLG